MDYYINQFHSCCFVVAAAAEISERRQEDLRAMESKR